MKTREEISRQLCQAILSAAQFEADEGRGFMVPSGTLPDLLPPQRLTADAARQLCGIEPRIWDAEHRRHMVVTEIVHGVRKAHRPPPRVTVDLP
jgi:hypothetical protein